MEWAEDLPKDCPPLDAIIANNNDIFFRAVSIFPPIEHDFYSPKKLQPDKHFRNECEAKALSMFSTLEGCQRLRKYSFFRNHTIVSLILGEESGLIKESPSPISETHYNWWLAAGFNPIKICIEVGRVS